jgi:hypothetical protein
VQPKFDTIMKVLRAVNFKQGSTVQVMYGKPAQEGQTASAAGAFFVRARPGNDFIFFTREN